MLIVSVHGRMRTSGWLTGITGQVHLCCVHLSTSGRLNSTYALLGVLCFLICAPSLALTLVFPWTCALFTRALLGSLLFSSWFVSRPYANLWVIPGNVPSSALTLVYPCHADGGA